MFKFTKQIARKLALLRKKNKFAQKEVAVRMKLKPGTGQSYIAQLENGLIKDIFLSTMLNYLDAIGVSWITFFTELSNEHNKQEYATK